MSLIIQKPGPGRVPPRTKIYNNNCQERPDIKTQSEMYSGSYIVLLWWCIIIITHPSSGLCSLKVVGFSTDIHGPKYIKLMQGTKDLIRPGYETPRSSCPEDGAPKQSHGNTKIAV